MKKILVLIMSIYISSITIAQPNVGENTSRDDIKKVQSFHILTYWTRRDKVFTHCFITDSIQSIAMGKVKNDIEYFSLAGTCIPLETNDYNCFISSLEKTSFSEASFESPGNRIMDIIVVNDTGKEVKYRVDMNKDSLKMDSLIMNCLPKNSENILSFIHEG